MSSKIRSKSLKLFKRWEVNEGEEEEEEDEECGTHKTVKTRIWPWL
jgi:hypothetical protein